MYELGTITKDLETRQVSMKCYMQNIDSRETMRDFYEKI